MTAAAHTPGPWVARGPARDTWLIDGNGADAIALTYAQANARLIAAAPDMLAALQAMLVVCDEGIENVSAMTLHDSISRIRVAIVKATDAR